MSDFIQVISREGEQTTMYIRKTDIRLIRPIFENNGKFTTTMPKKEGAFELDWDLEKAKKDHISWELEDYKGNVYSVGPILSERLELEEFLANSYHEKGGMGFKS